MTSADRLEEKGSLEPDLLLSLAKTNNISLPSPSDDLAFTSLETLLERYNNFTSLSDFLHYYFIGMSVLLTESDFASLAYAYFVRAKRDNVHHAEVFFDPQAHTSRGIAYSTIVAGFTSAQERARTELGITSKLIVCILRHLPPQSGHEMYLQALPDLKSGKVTGLGLSSTELGFPPELFTSTYAHALAEGITNLTAHAGEEAPVEYMSSALSALNIVRADHGIRLADDKVLMRTFAEKKLLVTMCPLSNLRLRCVSSIAKLPVRTFLDIGVRFSINSDDPAYFGGYILDNYCAVQEAFHLSFADWECIASNAIEGSWCDEERKVELRALMEAVMEKWNTI